MLLVSYLLCWANTKDKTKKHFCVRVFPLTSPVLGLIVKRQSPDYRIEQLFVCSIACSKTWTLPQWSLKPMTSSPVSCIIGKGNTDPLRDPSNLSLPALTALRAEYVIQNWVTYQTGRAGRKCQGPPSCCTTQRKTKAARLSWPCSVYNIE